jgi:uncharacterized membrane protein
MGAARDDLTAWARRSSRRKEDGKVERMRYRTSRNGVTSDSALIPFGRKSFADSLAVTLFGELL